MNLVQPNEETKQGRIYCDSNSGIKSRFEEEDCQHFFTVVCGLKIGGIDGTDGQIRPDLSFVLIKK